MTSWLTIFFSVLGSLATGKCIRDAEGDYFKNNQDSDTTISGTSGKEGFKRI